VGGRVVEDDRFFASVSDNGRWVNVCRLDVTADEVPGVVRDVQALEPGASFGWVLAEPAPDVVTALRDAGCRDPEPPLQPIFTSLATEQEPPAVDGVEVRRIKTFEEHLTGLEIMLGSDTWTEDGAARQRAEAAETYERRRARPGGEWLAFVDGRAVAWAGAVAGPRGLFLSGGSTLPEARGRGCYRALIRARWDEAVRRGTPALVVHAQESSRRILEHCGFERVCGMVELASGSR
jgi:GNAT superfamily N-acetyltransferase